LVEFARRRRRRLQLEFDAATKKAPVMMVVPLVLCVLPSFCLLALAPFLRGLSLSG
jgi:pilus assembly protein TadC